MSRLLREPLLHFLLFGATLFAVSGLTGRDRGAAPDGRIVVSEGRIAQLAAVFAKTWQRPPTRKELQGLVDDFVLEEIYYRQAVQMGLDRDDTVIRRRLRQKIEFLTDDAAALVEPGDEELAAYLAGHPEKFRRENRYTFRQVYINPDRHGDRLDDHIAGQLATLRQGGSVAGDSGMLEEGYRELPTRAVDAIFGIGFAERLDGLARGDWQGPIESGLGFHLVRIEAVAPGDLPELAEVRREVEREWANDKRTAMRGEMNRKLLQGYEVVVEWPESRS